MKKILIKDLKSSYNLEEFFKSRITNYKSHAAMYKLFEYAEADNPAQYTSNKFALVEHIQTQAFTKKDDTILSTQHKDVRILASKMVIDKFNQKYSALNESQKQMLREYINNVTNSVKLRKYVVSEVLKLKTTISHLKSDIPNKVIRIKLTEVSNLLTKLGKQHTLQDKDVLTMLRYYELVNELKNVGTK